MGDDLRTFGHTAGKLARNPLGIIALFIVLVYGFASLVTAFGGSLTPAERMPLIYFLVAFPLFVLAVFVGLVVYHPGKLYAPSDYRNEENFIRQISAATYLGLAEAKAGGTNVEETDLDRIAQVVREALPDTRGPSRPAHNRVLWVDDRPENNTYERKALEALGVSITLALSTGDALQMLQRNRYAAIISDMGRREGPREGYVLLEAIRARRDRTPFFIYAGSDSPEYRREAAERGAQGTTNSPQELLSFLMTALAR